MVLEKPCNLFPHIEDAGLCTRQSPIVRNVLIYIEDQSFDGSQWMSECVLQNKSADFCKGFVQSLALFLVP